MESQRINKLKEILEDLSTTVDETIAEKLELEEYHAIIESLNSPSSDCKACDQYFIKLENHVLKLTDNLEQFDENDFKHHQQKIDQIRSHLDNEHETATSHLGICLSLGSGLGMLFGLLIFDNLGLGLALGTGLGLSIGIIWDANAK